MSLFDSASLVVTPNGTKASKLYSIKPTDGSGDLVVTRATTATRVNSAGLIETVSTNVPRLDYSNGSCPSILVEPQRTNLYKYSEQFDNASWTKSNTTINANQTTAPDGATTADKLNDIISGSSNDYLLNVQSALSYTSGTPYTVSFYAKNIDRRYMYIRFVSNAFGVNKYAYFDLQDGVISKLDSGATATITSVGNGWYRCTATYTATVTTSTIYGIYIGLSADGLNNFYVNPSIKSVYIWGAQLEAGSYATSYIPTTSASVTRNADVISKTGISSLFGTNKGTVFCDFVAANIQGSTQYIFDTSDGSNATTNRFAFYKIAAGSYELFTNTATSVSINSNTRNKVAITWNGSSVKVYANGVLKNSITYANANPTKINLGTRFNNVEIGDVNYNSYCIFPTDLTDAQLIELTTI